MDFNDTPDEAAFRATVRAWLAAHAPARAAVQSTAPMMALPSEDAAAVARAKQWQKVKAAAGYAAIPWPREFGGLGGTAMQAVIYNQEESAYDVSSGMFVFGIGLVSPALMAHGTPQQQQRFIRPALYGEEVWCQLFSEPGAGSDMAGMRTTAVRNGNDWLINGHKIWTTLARAADWGILLARTDTAKVKHKGLSAFLIDMRAPGVTIKPIKQISGGSGFSEVLLDNVHVDDDMRVGAEGDGWKVALTVMLNERSSVGNLGGGVAIADMLALARHTELNDGPAIDNAAVREKIADLYIITQGLHYTRCRLLTALSQGKTPGPENSIAKAVGAAAGQDATALAIELMDLGGIIRDPGVSPFAAAFQDAWITSPAMRVAGGTDEILRNIIAEQILGLPGDIRADKDIPFNQTPTGR